MKIIDERETQKEKKAKTEKNKEDKSYSQKVRAKWFCCAFKLGFLQLICKASLIKVEFRVSFINYFKRKRIYESKQVAVECRCLKIWDLLPFLICFSILVLKWQVSTI